MNLNLIANTSFIVMTLAAAAGGWLARSAPADCVSLHGGTIRTMDVQIPQQGGGMLQGRVYAPQASLQVAPCPCIALLPGGGGGVSALDWAARLLAAEGYVVVNVQPAIGTSVDSYNTAIKSEIDFLLSPANPYRADADGEHIGAAAWSLGARVLTRTQEEDLRLDAIVAFDNLAKSESGDAGSPACTNQPGIIRPPRVPAMGHASESCENGPESKKTAYEHWRLNGVDSMELVFEGWDHFAWASVEPKIQQQVHYYTVAWFDRWLKDDASATPRLLATQVGGVPLTTLLSDQFYSAAFLDGYVCPDLRTKCAPFRPIAADFTGDGHVNGLDLAFLLANWGPCPGPGCAPDLDADGTVTGADLAALLSSWG